MKNNILVPPIPRVRLSCAGSYPETAAGNQPKFKKACTVKISTMELQPVSCPKETMDINVLGRTANSAETGQG